jgi:hypothetical protein
MKYDFAGIVVGGCATRRAGAARGILLAAALFVAPWLSGCGLGGYLPPERLPYAKLAVPYNSTRLKISTTLDVLNIARDPRYQFDRDRAEDVLLTQGDSVVAFSGRSPDSSKTWVNLIAFDEYRLTAKRKYFFLADERMEVSPTPTRGYLIPPRKGILFDAEFVIDPELLTTPYATEAAQRIAILRWLAEQLQKDVSAVLGDPAKPTQGSSVISIAGMMMGQTFSGLLIELNKSPGLAQNLSTPRGIEFPHIALGKGRVRLFTQGDMGAVTLRVNLPMPPLPMQ